MKNKSVSLIIIYAWLGVFCILPFLMVLIMSFLSKDPESLAALPLTLNNYKALFSPVFIKIFLRSSIIAALTTMICLLIAYPFSYLLVKSKHKSLLILLIIIPFWTSSLVRTYSLIAILKSKGLINTVLIKFHIINAPIELLYTNFSVLIGLAYNLFPFMVLPIMTNMERFDFRLIEAAKDLGASKWTIFTKVFWPNTTMGVASGCLMVFLPAMTIFYIPTILGGARSVLLGNMIQNQFLGLENWPQGAATSVLLTLILLLLLKLLRTNRRGVRAI